MSSIATTALNGNWVTATALHPTGIRARRQRRPPDGSPAARLPIAWLPVVRRVTVAGPPRTRTGVPQQPFARHRLTVVGQTGPRAPPDRDRVRHRRRRLGRAAAAFQGGDSSRPAVSSAAPGSSRCCRDRVAGRGFRCRARCCPGCRNCSATHASQPAGWSVLASGDPMFYGIGSTLVRLLGAERVPVLPHPSSVSLAAARLGWPLDDVEVVSLVGRPSSCCTRRCSRAGGCSR